MKGRGSSSGLLRVGHTGHTSCCFLSQYCVRNSRFNILPSFSWGNSSTKSTDFGFYSSQCYPRKGKSILPLFQVGPLPVPQRP